MLRKLWNSAINLAIVAVVALAVFLLYPTIDKIVDRHRITGLWHVEDSFADWRFGKDGTMREESFLTTNGRYQLLSGNRIRITNYMGSTMQYKYRFDGASLVLAGDGNPMSFQLTRKD